MLARRIIPCLDVKDGVVVKGIQFSQHQVVGDILTLAQFYSDQGADELVFYDITASCENRTACKQWVSQVAKQIAIPFCVAGGIRTLQEAETILNAGADKISINSPALENPFFIEQLAKTFGQQCVVVGIDSREMNGNYEVYQYTGNPDQSCSSQRQTLQWVREVIERGAGEIVLNCMNQDGMRKGYDIQQLQRVSQLCSVPLIASGGAGKMQDFLEIFTKAGVDGALAASVFHSGTITIPDLKKYLQQQGIEIRI